MTHLGHINQSALKAPDPKTRRWTVGFQYCERQFTSESMPREIAEQIQDSIEGELMTTAWLTDTGPLKP
jgi:hypothetical protein